MVTLSADGGSSAAPTQPSSKSTAATPKLNNDMEMGSLPGDDQNGEQEAQNDIMHFARVGDIPAMEKLFESGGYDATYTDDEGITPLHVRNPVRPTNSSPKPSKPAPGQRATE
jgi:palmitoyltransferase ZDHHC13/17